MQLRVLLLPKYNQFKGWSLPSKLTFISSYLGFLVLLWNISIGLYGYAHKHELSISDVSSSAVLMSTLAHDIIASNKDMSLEKNLILINNNSQNIWTDLEIISFAKVLINEESDNKWHFLSEGIVVPSRISGGGIFSIEYGHDLLKFTDRAINIKARDLDEKNGIYSILYSPVYIKNINSMTKNISRLTFNPNPDDSYKRSQKIGHYLDDNILSDINVPVLSGESHINILLLYIIKAKVNGVGFFKGVIGK